MWFCLIEWLFSTNTFVGNDLAISKARGMLSRQLTQNPFVFPYIILSFDLPNPIV